MTEDPTRQYDAADPSASYDWDFEDEEKARGDGPRLLWGRILALLVALVLVFFVGRSTVSAGSSDQEVQDLREQVAELQSQLDALETQAAAEASGEPASPAPSESAAGGEAEVEIYTVKPGDTLNTIAEDVYGDVGLGDELGEANGITDPEQLRVGDELEIPPEP